jgi:HEAT repeat protein
MLPLLSRVKSRSLPMCTAALAFFWCCAGIAAAESPPLPSLDETIAAAGTSEQSNRLTTDNRAQLAAVKALRSWPRTSAEDESRIATALGMLLQGSDPAIQLHAANALGHRDRREFIPLLLAASESNPHLLRNLVASLPNREANPPMEALRSALNAQNPRARAAAVELVGLCKAMALRPEVEALLDSDASGWVQTAAAEALGRLAASQSAPVLERAVRRTPPIIPAIDALWACGSDAQVPALIALLDSANAYVQTASVRALTRIKVVNPKPVCDALAGMIERESPAASPYAASVLLRYHDARGPSLFRRAIRSNSVPWETKFAFVQAARDFGGPDTVPLLHEMLALGWRSNFGVERALANIGDVSSGPLLWSAYLQMPIRRVVSGWCVTTGGYREALPVLEFCADRELLAQISARADQTTEKSEQRALCALVDRIEERLSSKP